MEDNKLLAEFMGKEWHNSFFAGVSIISPSNITYKFDTDWNWLMKVVEKIDEVCGIDLHEWDEHINNALCSKSLHTTYNACIEFIKWYNEQNKL